MSVRITDYSDTFDDGSYQNNGQLTLLPQWGGLDGTASPVVSLEAGVGGIYSNNTLQFAAAVHEGSYPTNQFAGFQQFLATNGSGTGDDHQGSALLLRYSGSISGTISYYKVTFNGRLSKIYIHKLDEPNGIDAQLLVKTIDHSQARYDNYFVEAEHISGNTTHIRIYQDDTLLDTYIDDAEVTGEQIGVAFYTSDAAYIPAIYSVLFGHIDSDLLRSLDSVSPTGIVKSNGGPITLTGEGLSEITNAYISEAGDVNAYNCTIVSTGAQAIELATFDIKSTDLTYGQLTMTLEHPTDNNLTKTFTMAIEDGWQSVVLSGATDNTLLLTDTVATNGDTMEIPSNDGFSTFTLSADGDVLIDAAANQGMVFERRLYDQTNSSWNVGNVTINQIDDTGGELVPPSWRSTPAPPDAVVGVYYEFPIGVLIDGSRPMTLTQAPGSNALPTGLNYNSSKSPETIEGTVTSGTGSITVPGIITRATNGA